MIAIISITAVFAVMLLILFFIDISPSDTPTKTLTAQNELESILLQFSRSKTQGVYSTTEAQHQLHFTGEDYAWTITLKELENSTLIQLTQGEADIQDWRLIIRNQQTLPSLHPIPRTIPRGDIQGDHRDILAWMGHSIWLARLNSWLVLYHDAHIYADPRGLKIEIMTSDSASQDWIVDLLKRVTRPLNASTWPTARERFDGWMSLIQHSEDPKIRALALRYILEDSELRQNNKTEALELTKTTGNDFIRYERMCAGLGDVEITTSMMMYELLYRDEPRHKHAWFNALSETLNETEVLVFYEQLLIHPDHELVNMAAAQLFEHTMSAHTLQRVTKTLLLHCQKHGTTSPGRIAPLSPEHKFIQSLIDTIATTTAPETLYALLWRLVDDHTLLLENILFESLRNHPVVFVHTYERFQNEQHDTASTYSDDNTLLTLIKVVYEHQLEALRDVLPLLPDELDEFHCTALDLLSTKHDFIDDVWCSAHSTYDQLDRSWNLLLNQPANIRSEMIQRIISRLQNESGSQMNRRLSAFTKRVFTGIAQLDELYPSILNSRPEAFPMMHSEVLVEWIKDQPEEEKPELIQQGQQLLLQIFIFITANNRELSLQVAHNLSVHISEWLEQHGTSALIPSLMKHPSHLGAAKLLYLIREKYQRDGALTLSAIDPALKGALSDETTPAGALTQTSPEDA